jgi:hypothetical protein
MGRQGKNGHFSVWQISQALVNNCLSSMKKVTTLITTIALASAAVAGPVQKQALTATDAAKLKQAQAQSQEALKVQAGKWNDDYNAPVTAACVVVAIGVTFAIIGLAD